MVSFQSRCCTLSIYTTPSTWPSVLWGALRDKKWASLVAGGMALFDIVGEFAAQGALAIQLNVSFLVAALLLVLAYFNWRRLARA